MINDYTIPLFLLLPAYIKVYFFILDKCVFFQELLLYLLQLVQALKYEDFDEIHEAYEREKEMPMPKPQIDRRGSESSSQSGDHSVTGSMIDRDRSVVRF